MKIHAIHVTVAAPRTLAALALAAASLVGGCFQPNGARRVSRSGRRTQASRTIV
jgi:hypothetical protein